ncbi:cytochrome c oxidase assembly protein [Marinospirillum perlucidum]|uniref:cytochrome c oxidase assembly protein n=1 Tax=Marinospirillum perlucidum TaxID=1982602 RepID=UPI000DF336C0|nr:cytochrome c oxidase assembly protein [Marinospirillum perlucidum]
MSANSRQEVQRGIARTVRRSLLLLLAMVGFTLALIPLYDVFCEVTGLNGKTAAQAQVISGEQIDTSRSIEVQFITRTHAGLPWALAAENTSMRVHPGEVVRADFEFVNLGQEAHWGKAVPSVSPSEGARYFRKMECFCFREQRLEAGERSQMPLVFQVDPDLPREVKQLTLAYTLYSHDQALGEKP